MGIGAGTAAAYPGIAGTDIQYRVLRSTSHQKAGHKPRRNIWIQCSVIVVVWNLLDQCDCFGRGNVVGVRSSSCNCVGTNLTILLRDVQPAIWTELERCGLGETSRAIQRRFA